jgi:hypothetical protein
MHQGILTVKSVLKRNVTVSWDGTLLQLERPLNLT